MLVKLPVGSFNPASEDMRIYGDFFNYNVIFNGDGFVRAVALDKDFNKIDEYGETWKIRMELPEGKAFTWLFPGTLKLESPNSNFLKFRVEVNPVARWIWLSLALAALHFLLLSRGKGYTLRKNLTGHLADLAIIVVSGIFGFLAVNIFPNRFFD